MQTAVVAGALVVVVAVQVRVAVAGLEVGAVVGGVEDDGVVVQALFLQLCHQPAEVLVEAGALAQIVRVLLRCVAAQSLQVLGQNKIGKPLLGAIGAFVVVMVVLMVRLDLGHSHEEGLFAGVLVEVVQRELVDAVSTVALKVDAVVVLVEHITVVAVGGEFQHIGCTPVAGIAAAQLQRNGCNGMVNSRLLFQLAVRGQMPLANIGRLIAGIFFHILAQSLDIRGQHQIIAEAACLSGVFSGLEQGAAGAAHRLGRESIVKFYALLCQLVQIGRDVQRLAEAAAGVPALLVTEVENNVICHGLYLLLLFHFRILRFLHLAAQDAEDDHHDQHNEDPAEHAAKEDVGAAVRDEQGAAEIGLRHVAQHHAQQHRDGGQLQLAHEPRHHAEHQRNAQVKIAAVHRVSTGKAEDDDDGGQDLLRDGDDLCKQAGQVLALQEHEDVHEDEAQHDSIHDGAVRGKEREAGVQAVDHQRGQHDGHAAVAGDAQRQQGDEGRAADGVVGRLSRSNALHRTMAELFRVLGHILCGVVGEPRGFRCTGAGHDAHAGADERANDNRAEHPLVLFLCDLAVVVADLSGVEVQLVPLQLRLANDLHQCEQADEGNGKVEAQIQAGDAEGKAVITGHGVCAHAGDEKAEAGGDDALDETLARDACDDGHAKQADHEVLRRAKLRRNFSHLRAEEEQDQRREDAAEGGGVERDLQCCFRAAHLGQRVAVQHGSRCVGRARRVDEDGRHRAAVSARTVDAQKEHHAGDGFHGVGDGQEQDDAEDDAQARNGREHAADKDTEVDPDDIFEGKEQPGGRADKIKQTHILPPQKLTFRTKWNTTQINTAIETVMA